VHASQLRHLRSTTPNAAATAPSNTVAAPPVKHHRSVAPLLPMTLLSKTRPLLVLDLDETLVHASVEKVPHEVCFGVNMGAQTVNVYVKIRPFAREFLKAVSAQFEVAMFTASLAAYADQVLDYLDPAKMYVHHRLFRSHCTNVDGVFLKDMSLLGRSLERVAIVDNSPIAYSLQPENGVPISSWFDDPSDTELMKMIPFLEFFAQVQDIYRATKTFRGKFHPMHASVH